MPKTLEQLKEQAAELARDAAISNALLKAGVRGKGLPLRTFLLEGDRVTARLDSNDEFVIEARGSDGKYRKLDDVITQLKRDPEWAANFVDFKPTTSGEDPNTGRSRSLEFVDVNSAIREDRSGQTLRDVASGKVQVRDSRRDQAELKDNEITADALMGGTADLQAIATGTKTIRFGN